MTNCQEGSYPGTGYTSESTEVTLPVDGKGFAVSASFQRDGATGGEAYRDVAVDTVLAVSGDRLTIVSHTMPDGDGYNWGAEDSPVRQMLPAATERLITDEAPTSPSSSSATPDASDPTDSSDPSTTNTSTPTVLSEENLLTADRIPALPKDLRAGAWKELPKQPTPTLACQGGWLRDLGATESLTREFAATSTPGGSDDYPLGMVRVAVLEFADTTAAGSAYATAQGWLEDCPATHAESGKPTVEQAATPVTIATSANVASVDRAHQVRTTSLPEDFCPDGCDASYFDVQTIAQIGTRLVFVSRAELAGPCAPGPGDPCTGAGAGLDPWLTRVDKTVQAAVGTAIWDLH